MGVERSGYGQTRKEITLVRTFFFLLFQVLKVPLPGIQLSYDQTRKEVLDWVIALPTQEMKSHCILSSNPILITIPSFFWCSSQSLVDFHCANISHHL